LGKPPAAPEPRARPSWPRDAVRAVAGTPLRLNVVIDQAPPSIFAQQNESILRGATVGASELDAQAGRTVQINLIPRSLDRLSASAVGAQLRAAHANALILPCDTDSEYQLAQEAAKSPVLLLAPCDADPTAGQRYASYWAVGMGANAEAAEVAQFIGFEGPKYVFVVNAGGAPRSLRQLSGYFAEAAPAAGRTIVGSATVSLTSPNYAALASDIESEKQRVVIFTTLPPPYVNRLVAGLAAHGVTRALFGTATMDTALTTTSGVALPEAYFASYGFLRDDAAAKLFAADYQRAYHSPPVGSFPGLGLETVRLLAQAATTARSTSTAAIDHVLSRGFTLTGVGLADRTYIAGGDHSPLAAVGISTAASGPITPVIAQLPANVPLP
jgi:hypothetical protein